MVPGEHLSFVQSCNTISTTVSVKGKYTSGPQETSHSFKIELEDVKRACIKPPVPVLAVSPSFPPK